MEMKEVRNNLIFGLTRIDEARGIAWIDGYSNARTLKQAVKQLAKAVEAVCPTEAKGIEDMAECGEISRFHDVDCIYAFDYDEVPGACNDVEYNGVYGSRHNGRTLKDYEVFCGIEYAAARFYLSTRIEVHN